MGVGTGCEDTSQGGGVAPCCREELLVHSGKEKWREDRQGTEIRSPPPPALVGPGEGQPGVKNDSEVV